MRALPIFASLTLLPVLAHADAPDGRPVRNSFVNHRVRTTADLLAHVRADRVVADRYERHFAMDRPTLLRFLGGLHRGRLAQAGSYTIYSVPKSGWLKMHVGRLPKGEPMFFDRASRPTLVVRCGNPVTLGPAKPRRAADRLGVSEPEGARGIAPADGLLFPDAVALLPDAPSPIIPNDTAVAVPSAVESVASVGASLAGSGTSWMGNLSFLPALVGMSHTTAPSRPTPKQPVPEPATLLVIAGGVALEARRRRASRPKGLR